ncbi:dihydrodipicolinate synthase family protein [Symmachiella dynata]|uniref:dihydrodipicolinate synthase family protein n=1 Tax=Symmachiella dynata TaxID=2527995 RepID=UPI0030ED97FC
MNSAEDPNTSPVGLRGMMPILPTAITREGAIDEASQRRLVQYCLKCGAVAIGHFGIASEFHKIPDHARQSLTEMIVDEVAGRVPVFLGVTAPGVGTSLNYARQAEQLGADMIMAALPYVDLPDAEGAFECYASLSEATTLPIIIQDTPASSSILTAQLLWRMDQEIAGVQHVKAEGKNFVTKTAQLLELSGGTISVIGGAGGKHLLHLLRLGVTAFMTGTEALDLHAAAVHTHLEGETEQAAKIYVEQILPYLQFYLDYSEELLKTMLHERGVIDCPDVLAPPAAPAMSAVEQAELDWILDRIGWRKRWPNIP